MGNQQSRAPGATEASGSSPRPGHQSGERSSRQDRARNRLSRADFFSLYGSGSGSHSHESGRIAGFGISAQEPAEDEPFRRKETRQEREARKREKERLVREKERERSLKEEGVDGGYLVTLGTYIGPEDFGKPVVRQLQIERKLAPFWKGLDNHDASWSDYQFACAARGLAIPDADATPPEGFFEEQAAGSNTGHSPAQNLSVPGFGSPEQSPTGLPSPPAVPTQRASSPFKPRGARLAAALSFGSSRSTSETEIVPREVMLPPEPFVNGKPIEAVLYREALECPICFLSYPPYLNYTRCCLQPICSECFVQIKRPDPHLPEHHPGDEHPPHDGNDDDELISEPSTCPYCQQTELGVTYEPPPFRRGLVYTSPVGEAGLASPASLQAASSSQTSLNSSTNLASPGTIGSRRRAQSLSATAPNVVTTDRIRPDWAIKLYTAQQIRARRAAAATALHTAAFMSGHQSSSWGGRLALFRRMTEAGLNTNPGAGPSFYRADQPAEANNAAEPAQPPARNRLDELEQVMFQEAIRQSLAHQEEQARKDAKKKEKATLKKQKEERKIKDKEDKKALKQQQKAQAGVYPGGAGSSASASRSSLSLPFGRRRGNSTSSNLRLGTTAQNTLAPHGESEEVRPLTQTSAQDKGKAPERPASHLRHISNASSMLSGPDSPSGSYSGAGAGPSSHEHLGKSREAHASGASLVSAESDGGNTSSDEPDPLFNYRSMAERMGIDIDTGRIEDTPAAIPEPPRVQDRQSDREEDDDGDSRAAQSVATLRPGSSLAPSEREPSMMLHHAGTFGPSAQREDTLIQPPELLVTPETPATGPGEGPDKMLDMGNPHVVESREVTQ